MIDPVADAKTWAAGLLFLGLAGLVGYSLPRQETVFRTPPPEIRTVPREVRRAFVPPLDGDLPSGPFGEMARLGEAIFRDTAAHAGEFVGNDLSCSNCHLDRGRAPNSAPLWAAIGTFPVYRAKNDHVNTFAERLQGCFTFSMNGKAPAAGDKVLVALESYAAALAKGAPFGESLPGRGYPKLPAPDRFDFARGERVYAASCALCHGADGAGQSTPDGRVVFPPLWGPRSYNWGAGMSVIANAASFIKANMPLSQGGRLSDEEAWAVAAYIDSRERPQDPRFVGSVAETRTAFHDTRFDLYGRSVGGKILGEASPPFGTVPRAP